jgi:hypothetical protein
VLTIRIGRRAAFTDAVLTGRFVFDMPHSAQGAVQESTALAADVERIRP